MDDSKPAVKSHRNIRCVICGMLADHSCSVCRSVFYCGAKCQAVDWEYHASEECNDPPMPFLLPILRQRINGTLAIGGPVDATPEQIATRKTRLETTVLKLYHQTNAEAADSIVESQSFRLGSVGYAGAGIYFAVTPEDTDLKAHEKGIILVATVQLGEVFHLTRSDRSINGEALHSRGYDSVYLKRPTGPEYVVYFPDQVLSIERHEREKMGRPKRTPLARLDQAPPPLKKTTETGRRKKINQDE